MGCYINPPDESKESFLAREAKQINEYDFNNAVFNEDELNICLVDNGPFTAAIICYCERELNYIQRANENDMRPKRYFRIDANKVKQYL
jgi:hypothetical protein